MLLSEQRQIAEEILQLLKKRQMDVERFKEGIHHLAEQNINKTFYTSDSISDEERRILQLCEQLAKTIRENYPNEQL